MKATNEKDMYTLRKELMDFLSHYSYKLIDFDINTLLVLADYSRKSDMDRWNYNYHKSTKYFELISLIEILNEARKGGEITIKYNKGNDILKLEMLNKYLVGYLWSTMNNLLVHNRHSLYMKAFDWEEREEVEPNDYEKYQSKMTKKEYEDMQILFKYLENIFIPYNKDEIARILRFEKGQMDLTMNKDRTLLSFLLNMTVKLFKAGGIFSTKQKTISTEDACFLYDYLILLGIMKDHRLNNKRKYDIIKNELSKLKFEDQEVLDKMDKEYIYLISLDFVE